MAKIEIIKSKSGYKLINRGTNRIPALKELGHILFESNRHNQIKFGCYNVSGGLFDTHINVYSYVSGKSERMNKKQYYKWLKGERQLTPKKMEEVWKPINNKLEVKLSGLEVKL